MLNRLRCSFHLRSDAYSAEQILLNKPQIYGGAPKLDCHRWHYCCVPLWQINSPKICDREMTNQTFYAAKLNLPLTMKFLKTVNEML